MSEARPKLQMILERVGPGNSAAHFRLWACRGARKGCPKKRKKHKHCPDCIETHDQQTLGEVYDKVMKGDA